MEHFTQRTKAFIIDAIIVTLFTALINNILYIFLSSINNQMLLSNYDIIVLAVVTILYFTILEAKTNKTIGKKMTHLYVSDDEGYMSYPKAFIRNLTKILWIPLIFDIIIGKILNCPSRLFDKLAGTDVYADEELEHVNSVQEYETEENISADESDSSVSTEEVSTSLKEDAESGEDIFVEEDKKDTEEIIVDKEVKETVEDEVTEETTETPLVDEIKPEVQNVVEETQYDEVIPKKTELDDDYSMTDEEIVKDIFGDEVEESDETTEFEEISSNTSEETVEESNDLTLNNLSEEVSNEEDDFIELEPEVKNDNVLIDDDFDYIDLTDIEDDEDDDFEELEPAYQTDQTEQKEE